MIGCEINTNSTVALPPRRNPNQYLRSTSSATIGVGGGEVHSSGAREGGVVGKRHGGLFLKSGGGVGASAGGRNATSGAARPVEYTMMLHPPLVVENLLPHAGDFELVDEVRVV